MRALRERVGDEPAYRRRVRLLSARHGAVHADQLIWPYRQPLTIDRAYRLREPVAAELQLDWVFDGVPAEVLVIASPLWMVALGGLLALPERPRAHWFTESDRDWPHVSAVLDSWGWP